MPKRIPHLPETILEQAATLFSRLGYDAVEMKQVAAEAGTSVGNLYNYFPSKPALFLAVKLRWKRQLVQVCRAILESDRPRRDRVLDVLRRIYDDLTSWRGLWSEFLRGPAERAEFIEAKMKMADSPPWGLGPDERALLSDFEALLTRAVSPPPSTRWALLTIAATIQLAARYPEEREENWKFLETLVDKI